MNVTKEQVRRMMPGTSIIVIDNHYDSMMKCTEMYQINTIRRIAAFMGQIYVESAGLTRMVENLNYSAEGLMKTWPKRFPSLEFANKYHRKPEKIANYVYAGRMGNGDTASGEGWKFRGRGPIQATGKDLYLLLSKVFGFDFIANPDALTQPPYAALSAGYYWHVNKINTFADKGDIRGVTYCINKGLLELNKRTDAYERNLKILQ
jgi:putative chitinase